MQWIVDPLSLLSGEDNSSTQCGKLLVCKVHACSGKGNCVSFVHKDGKTQKPSDKKK